MKKLLGVLLILIGVGLGLYVGGYLCFIGGIIDIVEFIKLLAKSDIVKGTLLAWGIAKMAFASLIGWLCAALPIGFGLSLFKSE